MSKVMEKSLIIKKETPFDKIRKTLLMVFFREEYQIERRINDFVKIKNVDISKIVIPREIKLNNS